MADRSVGELIPIKAMSPEALLLVEQDGVAKKMSGQQLENWLLSLQKVHGTIKNWRIDPLPDGLTFNLVLILTDDTEITVPIKNGKSIESIKFKGSAGLVDTYTIHYNAGPDDTFTVKNGAKGDTGAATYTFIRYASEDPSHEPHSFGTIPDAWMGVYVGPRSEAPTLWSDYQWMKIEGRQGDIGTPASVKFQEVAYQVSTSNTVPPDGPWLPAPPNVPQGQYLWSRETIRFNSGEPIIRYSVTYMGRDGLGTVSSFAGYTPDPMGNIDPQEWNLEVNHPVRSWWFSDDPKSPAELFGGTWERMEGRMLIGASSKYTAGSTYGSESVKLNISNIPPLGLDVYFDGNYNNSDIDQWKMFLPRGAWAQQETTGAKKQIGSFGSTHGGASEPVQTLGPVYATYIWRRIA